MRAVWRLLAGQRDLRLVLGAGLVSVAGDWILRVGLVFHVYVVTRSTVASALLMLASFVPQLALSSIAGVFADRWDRKRTMVGANLLLAAGLVPLALPGGGDRLWLVVAVMFWEGVVQQFFGPAEQALLPRLAPDDALPAANALVGQNRDLSRLTGSALGGVLAAAGGVAAVACADAASFVVSAALITLIATPGRADALDGHEAFSASGPEPFPDDGHASLDVGGTALRGRTAGDEVAVADQVSSLIGVRAASDRVAGTETDTDAAGHPDHGLRGAQARLKADLADGFRLTAGGLVTRMLVVFVVVTSIGEGVFSTLFAPFVEHVLHGGSEAYGAIMSVQAIGGVAGGFLAAAVGYRIAPVRLAGYGAAAFGLIDLAIFLYPLGYVAVWPATAGMILVGLPSALYAAGLMTLFQRAVADRYRGRVFGALGALEGAAFLIGIVAAGLLGQTLGIIPVLAFQGVAYLLAGTALLVVLRGEGVVPDAPSIRSEAPARPVARPSGQGANACAEPCPTACSATADTELVLAAAQMSANPAMVAADAGTSHTAAVAAAAAMAAAGLAAAANSPGQASLSLDAIAAAALSSPGSAAASASARTTTERHPVKPRKVPTVPIVTAGLHTAASGTAPAPSSALPRAAASHGPAARGVAASSHGPGSAAGGSAHIGTAHGGPNPAPTVHAPVHVPLRSHGHPPTRTPGTPEAHGDRP